jgi:hypothetical protein
MQKRKHKISPFELKISFENLLQSRGSLVNELKRATDEWERQVEQLRTNGYRFCILSLKEMDFIWRKLSNGESVKDELSQITNVSSFRQNSLWRELMEPAFEFALEKLVSARQPSNLAERIQFGSLLLGAFSKFLHSIGMDEGGHRLESKSIRGFLFPGENPHWTQVVLSFYISQANRLPYQEEVLVGSRSVTNEEIELFFRRCWFGCAGRLFSIANFKGFTKVLASRIFSFIQQSEDIQLFFLLEEDQALHFQGVSMERVGLLPLLRLCQELRRLRPDVEIRVHKSNLPGVGKTRLITKQLKVNQTLELYRCTNPDYLTKYFALMKARGPFRMDCTLDTGELEELMSLLIVFGIAFTGSDTLVLKEAKVELEISNSSTTGKALPFVDLLQLYEDNSDVYLRDYEIEMTNFERPWELDSILEGKTPGEIEIALKLFNYLHSIDPKRSDEIIKFADDWPASVRSSEPWDEVKEKVLLEVFNKEDKTHRLARIGELRMDDQFDNSFSLLFPNRRGNSSGSFAFTSDNVSKLALIKQFLKANIPVLLRGETGCGIFSALLSLSILTLLRENGSFQTT